MSGGNDQPRTLSTAIQAIAIPSSALPPTRSEDEARARITQLEREAKALGATPEAALLFHEIGLLWETPLKHPRNAAVAYQSAFRLAPRFLANIRAARRLFSEVGNWVMVAQLLEAELAATPSPRTRAALLFEKGQVLETRLSREGDAIEVYAQSLALEPEDVSLLCQLEQIFAEKADHHALVKVYRLLAQAVTDTAARAHYLTAAGLVLEDQVRDQPAAGACFREAFALDRRDPVLLAAMKRVAEREGKVEEELAALSAEAETQGALAGPTYLQLAKSYERLDKPDEALAALQSARKVAPGDPLILAELSRIYEARGRHEELADALRAWAQAVHDEGEVVSLYLRLASLYEDVLKRDAEATQAYQAILAKIPSHPAALAGQGKLYARAKNWDGLLKTFEAEAAAADDPRVKAGRVYKAAEVLEERLQRPEDAVARYVQCLELSPGFLPAQKALTRLYERFQRWTDLVAMLEQDLLNTQDREQQINTLHRIAALQEDRLDNLGAAVDSLKRVVELAPEHLPTIRSLQRLYDRAQRWQDLIDLNDHEAAFAGDTRQVISLAQRNAEIFEEQVKDRAAAIAALERVLGLSPTYLPGLKALGRLYAQDGQWEKLIQMYRTEAELAPSSEASAALIYKIGELHEKQSKTEQAIAAYQEVLTLSPHHAPAVRALARMYRTQGDWEHLIEVLRTEAANRTDPVERANALFQAAAIWEDQLHKPDKASEAYQEVVRLAPNHASALHQLERLLSQKDELKELIVVLDRQTQVGADAMRVSAFLKLARLYLDRLGETQRAATYCDQALAIEPGNLSALKLLERIRSSDRPRRNEVRHRLAAAVSDPKLAAALRLAASEAELQPGGRPTEGLLAQLKAAWEQDPTDESLGLMLEKALVRLGDDRALLDLYGARMAQPLEATDRLQLHLRIADLCENRLGDLARAAQAYEAAAELSPGLYPALRGLARCFLALQNPEKARLALGAVARAARDPASAIEAWMEAAALALKANDTEGAIGLYRQVLEKDPLHPEAGPGLEDLLAAKGGAADLAALHERRGDAKAASKDPAGAAGEYFAAARTWATQLQDAPHALAALEKALAAQPTHVEALELKGELAWKAQAWADAAQAWSVRVQQGGEAKTLARLHLLLGSLYQDHLQDPTRAAAHLQTVLTTDPVNADALERLAVVHAAAGNWTGAAEALNTLLAQELPNPVRARHTVLLARITDEGFGEPGTATGLYQKALALVPGDAGVLERLVDLYQRQGALAELAQVLEAQAQGSLDPARAVTLRLRAGEIYDQRLNNAHRAVQAYRSVLELNPHSAPALAALADLYGRDPNTVALSIECHRALLRMDASRTESLHALFRIWEGLRQFDRALCVCGVLTFLKAANEAEAAFYNEGRSRLPQDPTAAVGAQEVQVLHHPGARNPLVDVLRAVGDQLVKVFPPQLDAFGVDRKADRLKPDHAIHKAVRVCAAQFGVDEFDVYQAKRGLVTLETTEPLGVLVSAAAVQRFNAREQRFLLGRAALGLFDKAAVLRRLGVSELQDFFGNTVRIHQPELQGLGRRNDEQSKQLRRAYSRRSLKLLEQPAQAVATTPGLDAATTAEAVLLSMDRAGLLLCGDVGAALGALLKDENGPRSEEPVAAAQSRRDVRELIQFAVSDDFFRLRQRIGMALG